MAIVLGLLTALGWGTTDLLVRLAGRRLGVLRAMFFGQCIGFILLTAWLVLSPAGASLPARAGAAAWIAAVVAAFVTLGATASLFHGLAVGRLSVVSPVSASYGVVTAILAMASGEALMPGAAAGGALTVCGVALASSASGGVRGNPPGPGKRWAANTGLAWALLAALNFGVGSWLMGMFAVPALGRVIPVWIYYAVGVATLAAWSRAADQPLTWPQMGSRAFVLGIGLLGSASFIAFSVGLGTGQVAVVTVLSSLSTAVTVLLARAVIAERVLARQWVGIGTILLGLALIDAGG